MVSRDCEKRKEMDKSEEGNNMKSVGISKKKSIANKDQKVLMNGKPVDGWARSAHRTLKLPSFP